MGSLVTAAPTTHSARCGDFPVESESPAYGGLLWPCVVSGEIVPGSSELERPEFSGLEFAFPRKRRLWCGDGFENSARGEFQVE